MTKIISVNNLTKKYKDKDQELVIYDDLSWSVDKGDYIAIMGRSWSGKTTLLHMLAWIEGGYQWELFVQWKSLHTMNNDERTSFRSQHISFVFQDFHLLPHLTVEENIDMMIDMNNRTREFSTREIIERVWLIWKEKSYVSILSGWEQQRVALARAFVCKTDLLLADEPTGNLDEKNAMIVMNIMKELHESTGTTIVMITHDQGIASNAKKCYKVDNQGLKLL